MFETPLCELAYKHGTDKCPQIKHNYTPYYWELLKDKRDSVLKVLELGVQFGNSLRMWRDFFPNAGIYGVDFDPKAMFEETRIKTFLFHERDAEGWENLIKRIGSDIDIFIDDGRHRKVDNAFVAKTLLPLLKKDVIYIVEDLIEYDLFVPMIPYKCEQIPLKPGGTRDGMVRIYNET